MPHPRYASGEIGRIGHEIYETKLRALVETEENIGKIISIDIESGEYAIGEDVLETAKRLLNKNPDAALWGERIGYDAVFAVVGSIRRVAP